MKFTNLVFLALLAGVEGESNLFLQEATDAELTPEQPESPKNPLDLNEQPTIGILTQTLESGMKKNPAFDGYTSYIMAAYVKYVEAQGARVVPIIYGESWETTKDKLDQLDGVLFPGGGGDYLEVGRKILDYVTDQNDNGHFYPLWGTCLGYERLLIYTADLGKDVLTNIELHKKSIPLKFTRDPRKTRMYAPLGLKAFEFEKKNLTYNSHTWAVAPELFETDKGLADFWDLTAISTIPGNGTAFAASIEAKKYPIFATQFHPEKPSELWTDGYDIDHSWESIQLQSIFGKEFVAMARENTNSFANFTEYAKYDISNYPTIQTFEEMADAYAFKMPT